MCTHCTFPFNALRPSRSSAGSLVRIAGITFCILLLKIAYFPDAAFVSAAFKFGFEPQLDRLFRLVVGNVAGAERKNIRLVVTLSASRHFHGTAVIHRCPNAFYLISRYRLSLSGCPEYNTPMFLEILGHLSRRRNN